MRTTLLGLLLLGLTLSACESSPPAERKPQSRSTASKPEPAAPTHPGTEQPASAATTPPAPTTEPSATTSQPPDYITVVERYDAQKRATVTARPSDGNQLAIETRNVKRLRIDRGRAGLNLQRSVALQLDGQGIEWLARSPVVEFERSINGEWAPVRPETAP